MKAQIKHMPFWLENCLVSAVNDKSPQHNLFQRNDPHGFERIEKLEGNLCIGLGLITSRDWICTGLARSINAPRVSNPTEDAQKFCDEFSRQYGEIGPDWLETDWNEATQNAHRQFKMLFIYLHSPFHEVSHFEVHDHNSLVEIFLCVPAFLAIFLLSVFLVFSTTLQWSWLGLGRLTKLTWTHHSRRSISATMITVPQCASVWQSAENARCGKPPASSV